jgi:ribosomal protein L7Ae-like RNA K-turn-binding protein
MTESAKTDDATGTPRDAAVRQSAWTKSRAAKAGLIRLVLSPEGRPGLDLSAKGGGRGLSLEADRAVIFEALSPKGAPKLFKGKSKGLGKDEIEALIADAIARLEGRILELCGLARRAGELIMGLDPVLEALQTMPKLVVVTAGDLSERSSHKLFEALAQSPQATQVVLSTKTEIGTRTGRVDVGVVAIRPSSLAERVAVEVERRRGLMGTSEV